MSNTTISYAAALFLPCIFVASLPVRCSPASSTRAGLQSSIFGNGIARPFHQLFLAVTISHTVRHVLFPDGHGGGVGGGEYVHRSFVWAALESILFNFLMLCMPYILQRHLATVINIRPGKDLQNWLAMVFAMDFTSVVLSLSISPNFWSIKRLGDGLMVIPRIQILQSYQKIVTARANQPSLLVDMLIRFEMCLLVATVGTAIAYAVQSHDGGNGWLAAIKMMWIFMKYTALMIHALLLNCLDEGYSRSTSMPQTEDADVGGDFDCEMGPVTSSLIVPVRRT